MEIRQLRHFITAVEAGNLRKASERIHITHPALSTSISNLEEDLGKKLLLRSHNGVQLTYAGQQFFEVAQSLLRQIEDIRATLLSTEDSPTGKVRLGMTVGINNALAAPLFKILLERYPGINLEVEEGNTTSLERLFNNGLLDLMVSYDTKERGDQQIVPLYKEHMYLVSAYNPAYDNAEHINFAELVNYPIVSSPGTHSMRRTLETYADENNVHFNFLIDFQSAHASLKIVQEGLANMISPWDLIHDHVESKLVSARKIVSPAIERTACLVSSLRNGQAQASLAIINAIKVSIHEALIQGKIRGEACFKQTQD